MDEMIAYCGLNCTGCPAFIATRNDDDEERKRVAAMWSKQFGAEIAPGDINCDGCLVTDGRHIGYCSTCEIRKCGQERAVVNCADCGDYACEKLEKFFKMAPEARKRLEGIRKDR